MRHDKRLKIGWKLTAAAGTFPLSVGVLHLALFLLSLANPTQAWRAEPFKDTSYSIADVGRFSGEHEKDFVAGVHEKFVNLINTGVAVIVVSVFGLRKGHRWAWSLLLAMITWVAGNGALVVLHTGGVPVPLLPLALGVTGLVISWPAVRPRTASSAPPVTVRALAYGRA